MKKILSKFCLTCIISIILSASVLAQEQSNRAYGTVLISGTEEPLIGATVKIKNRNIVVITDQEGKFNFPINREEEITLEISFIGFVKREINTKLPQENELIIYLEEDNLNLGEVQVFATGYQEIPKERATGSFVGLDQELISRRVSTNLIDRLEDVTSGLIFNRNSGAASSNDRISIRGRGTIFSETSPLIILDNFPYDGPLENINPNDIESITVLRDAAAASIWGARAGNGVIVITTKSGQEGKTNITFTSNTNIIEAPNLFYRPQMNIGDFVEMERTLFQRNFYNAQENSIAQNALSPVVETLIAHRNGLISEQEANQMLNAFSNQDVRNDLSRFYQRSAVQQQTALNITGGTARRTYAFSLGYDNNLSSEIGNKNDRVTISQRTNWKLLNDKLDFNLGLNYIRRSITTGTNMPTVSTIAPYVFPYSQLRDQNGNVLPVIQNFSQRFINSVANQGLLDWQYFLLDEIGQFGENNIQNEIRITTGLKYNIRPWLSIESSYQYWTNSTQNDHIQSTALFQTRDLINRFSQVDANGDLLRNIPEGSIYDLSIQNAFSHTFRNQLRLNKSFGNKLDLNGLIGNEIKDFQSLGNSIRYYGYNDDLGISQSINFLGRFPQFQNPGSLGTIPNPSGHNGAIDRFISYYANVGLTYNDKYTWTFSARQDASNLFGVDVNLRAVPLWSSGLAWNISEENFFNWDFFSFLKLRATFGSNGNINRSLSAFTTSGILGAGSNQLTRIPFSTIRNPPNANLRWEVNNVLNFGIDFDLKNDVLSGSIETYFKNGNDLIGDSFFPAATGVTSFRGNFANTSTNGVDLMLTSNNLKRGIVWKTTYLLSWVKEKVTGYENEATIISYLNNAAGNGPATPREGFPLFSLYSIPDAGLDPNTGEPRGFINGEPSTNYTGIISNLSFDNVNYHGPARPTAFGSIRNDFYWQNFNLSFNVTYRTGYFYRDFSVNYDELLRGRITHADFNQRWQEPGDELTTNVPALPTTLNPTRDVFYRLSESLVRKGDHVRLQDIRLGYTFNKTRIKSLPFESAEIYTYVNNVGILWKAEKNDPLDPDFRVNQPLRSIAAGLRINF
ncbi:SusC/RagA family TonB-linked outer membrane protein [Belliella pelovolcani]|uniref:TonB-linked outer membrane protein, SusC/RagA family n=1 Tax=Belliella pelovolcani TaxID=529505 RepID=A0A1N7KEA8_9BACT|nr:SusC/RagA family TonB-linked outer membrane protein [Belliella pelovolcani]SIS59895.1 TonB-linked outer membrane protein, SusC/RagA family [Belliella pelovolcani]